MTEKAKDDFDAGILAFEYGGPKAGITATPFARPSPIAGSPPIAWSPPIAGSSPIAKFSQTATSSPIAGSFHPTESPNVASLPTVEPCYKCVKYKDLLSQVLQDTLKFQNFASLMSTDSENLLNLSLRKASVFNLLHEAALLKETAAKPSRRRKNKVSELSVKMLHWNSCGYSLSQNHRTNGHGVKH